MSENDVLERDLPAVQAFAATLESVGKAFTDQNMNVQRKLEEASQSFERLENRVVELGYTDRILHSTAADLSTHFQECSRQDNNTPVEDVIRSRRSLLVALSLFVRKLSDEILKARLKEPDLVRRFGIEEGLDNLIASVPPLRDTVNTPDIQTLERRLPDVGGFWGAASTFLGRWVSAGLSTGGLWKSDCTCGTETTSQICVVDDGVFCDTYEWHRKEKTPA